jgi:hypothetical protein
MSQMDAMNIASSQISNQTMRDAGPPLALLAILYAVLFNAGLYPVTAMASKSYWPGPWESADVIVPYLSVCSIGALLFFLCFGRSGILRSDGTVYGGSIGPQRVFETAAQVGHRARDDFGCDG